uniref:hypothetical protein n=1 Tax=Klebsiella aerogenes TaxID=548 RepID=UPI001953C92D
IIKTAYQHYREARFEKAARDIKSAAIQEVDGVKTRIDAIAQPIDKANVIGGAKGDTERHQADAEQALAPAYDALAKAEVTKTAFETREG